MPVVFGLGSEVMLPLGRLACKNDPRNPWTGAELLKTFVDLNNKYSPSRALAQRVVDSLYRVLARFTAEERKDIGIHTCPGGDCDSVHSLGS
jgi:hypothetical protein